MAKLILVKHASPVIAPDIATPCWVLSDFRLEDAAHAFPAE